ncbi:MAG: hypothetical protein K1X75_09035 [Leptospirales bacterium]|nr:hypothetical protein [Leptospirales bacterium]
MIRRLEEYRLNAWPGSRRLYVDGMVLRLSGAFGPESNCALQLWPGRGALQDRLTLGAAIMRSAGLPARFRIAPLEDHRRLSEALQARGFRAEAEYCLFRLAAAGIKIPPPAECSVAIEERGLHSWLAAAAECDYCSPELLPRLAAILEQIPTRRALLVAYLQGEASTIGLAVLEQTAATVPVLWTRPDRRRLGLATAALSSLHAWSQSCGANQLHLQIPALDSGAMAFLQNRNGKETYRVQYLSAH